MDRTGVSESRPSFWETASELPAEVFQIWHKPDRAISPVAVVATIDPDGAPRTAPFGSLRAITPHLLRLCSHRAHDTYANLCRDGHVSVALVYPGVAVSVRGRGRLVREHMDPDQTFAVFEIDVEQVKNDTAYRFAIESPITISAREPWGVWVDSIMTELESIDTGLALAAQR